MPRPLHCLLWGLQLPGLTWETRSPPSRQELTLSATLGGNTAISGVSRQGALTAELAGILKPRGMCVEPNPLMCPHTERLSWWKPPFWGDLSLSPDPSPSPQSSGLYFLFAPVQAARPTACARGHSCRGICPRVLIRLSRSCPRRPPGTAARFRRLDARTALADIRSEHVYIVHIVPRLHRECPGHRDFGAPGISLCC